MGRFSVGYSIQPQHCTTDQVREAFRSAEEAGADTVYVWDHMFPLRGDPDGPNYGSTPLLGALAAETRRVRFGALVASNGYRNPELYAHEIWTLNRISHGRAILGIGAGWFQRDHDEFGYAYGDAPARLRALAGALPRIRERLRRIDQVNGDGAIPILVGGGGERVTLRLAGAYADLWSGFPPMETWRHKNRVLDGWCERAGRDPAAIGRIISLQATELDLVDEAVASGAREIILRGPAPFDMAPLRALVDRAAA
jgi:probable F420-dependent oxidoreductase